MTAYQCPICRSQSLKETGQSTLLCEACSSLYPKKDKAWDFRTLFENIDTQWSAEAFDKAYQQLENKYTDGYENARRSHIPIFIEDYRIARVKDYIGKWIVDLKHAETLEVGCGYGWYAFRLYEKFGFKGKITGIDVSPFRINIFLNEIAKRGFGEKMDACVANGEALPFLDAQFDLVFMSEVLEHVESPVENFKAIARVLKPGGSLIITTPCGPVAHFWEALFSIPRFFKRLCTGKLGQPSNLNVYDKPLSKNDIKGALAKAGLVIKRYEQTVFLPHESFLQFFPTWMLHIMLWGAKIIEKISLFQFAGLHQIVHVQKPS